MNATLRRGLCPTLAEPMQTGDGLLVRLNPVASALLPKALIGLCEAALRHGNGVVEVTSRGSFQIRGLTARSARRLADEVDALGIAVRSGVPVETGPLAGLDANEIIDPRPLAERIREDIAAAGLEQRLGPKVSVIVDGGGHSGLDAISADIRLTAARGGPDAAWRVAVAGSAATAREFIGDLTLDAAYGATLAILTAVAELGREGRARDLSRDSLESIVFKGRRSTLPPSVLPDISPTGGEIGQSPTLPLPISPQVGEMSGRTEGGNVERQPDRPSIRQRLAPGIFPLTDSRFAIAITLPFGHTRAETLIEFIKAAEPLGAAEIRLAPRRTLLLFCPTETLARAVLGAAGTAGLITDPADPRTWIAACPGSPACASGHIPARAIAAEIAASMPRDLALDLHISGCAKRCASPRHDGLTLLGKPDSAALVLGRPGATPLAHVAHEHGAAAIGRVLQLITAQRKPDVPDQRCMYRLGKARIAQAFREED